MKHNINLRCWVLVSCEGEEASLRVKAFKSQFPQADLVTAHIPDASVTLSSTSLQLLHIFTTFLSTPVDFMKSELSPLLSANINMKFFSFSTTLNCTMVLTQELNPETIVFASRNERMLLELHDFITKHNFNDFTLEESPPQFLISTDAPRIEVDHLFTSCSVPRSSRSSTPQPLPEVQVFTVNELDCAICVLVISRCKSTRNISKAALISVRSAHLLPLSLTCIRTSQPVSQQGESRQTFQYYPNQALSAITNMRILTE